MRRPQTYATAARRHGLAAVGVGRWALTREFSGLPYVDVNPEAVGEMAAEYLARRGFRSFGMIALERIRFFRLFLSRYRGEAFVEALRRKGLACDVFDGKKKYPPCSEPLPAVSAIAERVCRWLASLPKPSGVFCISDSIGVWVCDLCRRAGIHIPEEVAVLGANDDSLFCGMANPHLSSITVPAEQVGYEAAKLLGTMLKGRKAPKHPILLPPLDVITRQSTDVMATDDRRVVEAMRFIREHACDGIRVEHVMKEVSLPRRTLEQRFKAALNQSPFAEIRRVQIERVKTLLAQTDETLEAIAPECGFEGVTRMNMAFKKATGMPPGAYRKQFRSR